MPPTTTSPAGTVGGGLRGLVLPVTIVGAILVFVVPIPPGLLDVLLSANLTVALVVLLTTLSIRAPQEFSAFPTILLTTTLTRLVLNVATTRLVLTRGGEDGLDAAGGVIRSFGEFVAGDQVIVGVILFSILVVIQFVVITRGATRISEVAARFMLDGLPGRQMAIDADLHAGLIDQHEAHRRREEVYRQADFFGAMDGAGKFVRGDAVAGVVILLVNIAGGPVPGRGEPRHGDRRGGQRLHQADDRRRPGEPGAGVPDLAGLGDHRDPLVVLDGPEPRRARAALLAARGAGRGGRVPGPDGADAAAQAAAAGPGRRPGDRRGAAGLSPGRGGRGTAGGRDRCRAPAPARIRPGRGRTRPGPPPWGRRESSPRARDPRRWRAGGVRLRPDGRPAARGPARAGDRLPADRAGRPVPRRRPARTAQVGAAAGRAGDGADRAPGADPRLDRPAAQRVPGEDPRDAGRAGDRLRRAACWPCPPPGWSPAPTAATASIRSPASRPSGSTPTAARWPSWPAAASSTPPRSSPATSARSSPTTPTSC